MSERVGKLGGYNFICCFVNESKSFSRYSYFEETNFFFFLEIGLLFVGILTYYVHKLTNPKKLKAVGIFKH